MEDAGVPIVDVDGVRNDVIAVVVGLAVIDTRHKASARDPGGKATAIVVAALCQFRPFFHTPRRFTSLYSGGVWNRIPKGPHMKRLLGCLLLMGVVGVAGCSGQHGHDRDEKAVLPADADPSVESENGPPGRPLETDNKPPVPVGDADPAVAVLEEFGTTIERNEQGEVVQVYKFGELSDACFATSQRVDHAAEANPHRNRDHRLPTKRAAVIVVSTSRFICPPRSTSRWSSRHVFGGCRLFPRSCFPKRSRERTFARYRRR